MWPCLRPHLFPKGQAGLSGEASPGASLEESAGPQVPLEKGLLPSCQEPPLASWLRERLQRGLSPRRLMMGGLSSCCPLAKQMGQKPRETNPGLCEEEDGAGRKPRPPGQLQNRRGPFCQLLGGVGLAHSLLDAGPPCLLPPLGRLRRPKPWPRLCPKPLGYLWRNFLSLALAHQRQGHSALPPDRGTVRVKGHTSRVPLFSPIPAPPHGRTPPQRSLFW